MRRRAVIFYLAGMSCLVAAAFVWSVTAGLVSTGVAMLITEWRLGREG